MVFKTIELFGGAMRCAVPPSMVDVSDFRQVPDNQEVYNDPITGATIIVELLSRQASVANESAGSFFYSDLAKDNGCTQQGVDFQIQSVTPLAPSSYPHLARLPEGAAPNSGRVCGYACLTTGTQSISKYTNEQGRENTVYVALVVLRFLPLISTEILVSLSAPEVINPSSSDARSIERVLTPEERDVVLAEVVRNLEVAEWGLFVPEEG